MKIYHRLETAFHRLSKHLEFRQKYFASPRIFNSLLGFRYPDETNSLVFDILLKIKVHTKLSVNAKLDVYTTFHVDAKLYFHSKLSSGHKLYVPRNLDVDTELTLSKNVACAQTSAPHKVWRPKNLDVHTQVVFK